MAYRHLRGRETAGNRGLRSIFPLTREPVSSELLRRQPLQPIDQVERLARAELVWAGVAQQGLGRRFLRRRLGLAAGGAEQWQVIGEARQGTTLLALLQYPQHL